MTSCTGGGGTGTKYTYSQLEGLWINAGGSTALAPLMAAIAMAESGGCSTALNPSGASGLWQILGAVNPADQNSLFNPAVNAKEAVLKYQTQGPTAWTTYSSGAYKAFISNSTTPDTSVSSSSGTATLDSSTTSSDCAITFPGIDLGVTSVGGGCLVTYGTERAIISGLILGAAGILALAGLVILAASALGSTPAGRIAESVTPVGRVVKAAGGAVPRRKPAPAAPDVSKIKAPRERTTARESAAHNRAVDEAEGR
jgi:Lysozyme like domain